MAFDLSGLKPLDAAESDAAPARAPRFDVSGLKPYDAQEEFAGYGSVAARGLARGAIDTGGEVLKGVGVASAALDRNRAGFREAVGAEPDQEPVPTLPTREQPIYQAGESVQQFGRDKLPMTRAEEGSFTGQVSRTVGAIAPLVAEAVVAPELALPTAAATFGAQSAGSTFDETMRARADQARSATEGLGGTPQQGKAAFDAAMQSGANEEDAAKAAGFSALIGAGLGVLPLGIIMRPVRQVAPGLTGWAAAKLEQAIQSGIVFGSVGEAQHYLGKEVEREFSDPNAHYDFDPKRLAVSLISGGVLGVVHPLAEHPISSPEEIWGMVGEARRRAAEDEARAHGATTDEEIKQYFRDKEVKDAQARGARTREEIDEFIRQKDANAAPSNFPRLPPPSEPGTPAPPQPEPPIAPAAPRGAIDPAFPPLEQEGGPPAIIPEVPREPQAQAPRLDATGLIPLEAAGTEAGGLQAPASNEEAQDQARQNVGHRDVLEALLKDERPLEEIKSEVEKRQAIEQKAIEDAKNWRPTDEWAQVPPGVMSLFSPSNEGGKIDMPGLETREEGGKLLARIAPPAGSREHPVALDTPAAVFHAAERTAEPTPAQAAAGNYQKRHMTWQGLDIAIETEAGMQRTGVGADGKPWSVTLTSPYGYIKGTRGRDGDQLDVYLGTEPNSPHVFVVDQIDHRARAFDEHKAMIGFPDEASARKAFHAAFSDGNGPARIGAIRALTVPEFKAWVADGNHRKPLKYRDPHEAVRAYANEQGLTLTDEERQTAVDAQSVKSADVPTAVVDAIEQGSVEKYRPEYDTEDEEPTHGLASATARAPSAESPTASAPRQEPEAARAPGPPPPRVEPDEAERDRSEAPVEVARAVAPEKTPQPESPKPDVSREASEPALERGPRISTATLVDIAKRLPGMAPAARERARGEIDALIARMDKDGAAIAKHCAETGGRFSIR